MFAELLVRRSEMYKHSVALTESVDDALVGHLLRMDGQEDICLATYATSTGRERTTRIIQEVHLPRDGERQVHGNATIMGSYVLRVAAVAATKGHGLAILHSHPAGRGWQDMSDLDSETEYSYSTLAQEVTGRPLVGMTLAGDGRWSGRVWLSGRAESVGSVRRVGDALSVSFNDRVVPPLLPSPSQLRTVSAWGEAAHRDITRIRVLVVGLGSVGLDVAQRIAASGFFEVGVMDFDRVDQVNLDRMIGATRLDARRRRLKVDVAARLARSAATARSFKVNTHCETVTSAEGLRVALDYDVVFSCVDRPWPRALMNAIAYADLIPVIDAGIGIDTHDDGRMRGATRRAQVLVPGRPCLACTRQIRMADVALDIQGLLDDPEYIKASGREPIGGRPNVALLSAAVSASQLELLVSLVARPGGQGVPRALRFTLALHRLEHLPDVTQTHCVTEALLGVGDDRIDLTRRNHLPPIREDSARGRSSIAHWRGIRSVLSTIRAKVGL